MPLRRGSRISPTDAPRFRMRSMNLVKKLMSWWRGPTDPETLASEAERQRLEARRETIKVSQSLPAKQTGASLLSAPTPDLLDPESEDSHRSG
jgi:hypothetical protein